MRIVQAACQEAQKAWQKVHEGLSEKAPGGQLGRVSRGS